MGTVDERLGRSLGKYTLVRVIGSGGMAVVYEARHKNGLRVAVKMLRPELAVGADLRARFRGEGYAANAVRHPGVVRILDDDVTADGLVFLVMELLEGRTLGAFARAHDGTLPVPVVMAVGKQLLDVLAAAHAAGVIHRDVKPENVFLQCNGHLKVLDFGVARIFDPERASTTKTGRMLGTPAFMPPEQAYGRRDEVDERSDVWSAGATLFTVLIGRAVHEADVAEEALIKAATERAPRIAEIAPDVPAPIASVIDRALESERTARFGSAREMSAALENAHREIFGSPIAAEIAIPVEGSESTSTTTTPPRRRRWPIAAMLAGGTAVAIAAGAARRLPPLSPAPPLDVPRAELEPHASVPNALVADANHVAEPPRGAAFRAVGPVARADGTSTATDPVASAAPRSEPRACFEVDDDGRKWPRRCR